MAVRRFRPWCRARRDHDHAHHDGLNDIDPQVWLADVFACIAAIPQTRPARVLALEWT